jgi:DNA-binding IclR family transcriptional regulator
MQTLKKAPQGIASVEIGAQILRAMAAAPSAQPLKSIAASAGMPASKAYRYLVSFQRAGLVTQDPQSGWYDLGPLSLGLGFAALNRVDVVRLAASSLEQARDAVAETVALFIWGPAGPTVIRLAESSHPVQMTMRVGSVTPFLASAAGRLFAAYLPEATIAPLIEAELAQCGPGEDHRLPRSWLDVQALLSEVRARRLARVTGEFLAGVSALGAPIFDQHGQLKAVVTAVGPREAFDASWDGPIAQALTAFAQRFSNEVQPS